MTTCTEPAVAGLTRVEVTASGRGRARVLTATAGPPDRPVVRPVVLSADRGSARVSLVPEGALLLEGDRIQLQVEVGPDVLLELVEPGGTVAHDMQGGTAHWHVHIRLAPGAALIWHGEPFVVATGAHVLRRTHVVVGQGARLALRETLVLGRYDEVGGVLHQGTVVEEPDGTPVLVEELAFRPGSGPGVLGGHRVLASALVLGVDPPDQHAGDVLRLEGGGSVARRVASATHEAELASWGASVAAVRGSPTT